MNEIICQESEVSGDVRETRLSSCAVRSGSQGGGGGVGLKAGGAVREGVSVERTRFIRAEWRLGSGQDSRSGGRVVLALGTSGWAESGRL